MKLWLPQNVSFFLKPRPEFPYELNRNKMVGFESDDLK